MTDVTDAGTTADTQAQAPELKSTDTGVLAALKQDTATPALESQAQKPVDAPTPAVNGGDAESSEAEHQDDDRKIEPWMRKRLQRAEEKARKQARAEMLEEIRTLREAPADPPKTEPQATIDAQRSLADFDYDLEKYNAYMVSEGIKRALADRDAEQDRRRKEQADQEARGAFETRKAEFEARVGEGAWDDMISARVDVPQEIVDLLAGHPRDLDIAHYLVHHPDELDKLRGKSRLETARELSQIDARLSGSAEELPPKTTKTPPPPPTVPGAGKPSKTIDDMSTSERIAEWRRQAQARRQA